MAHRLTYPSMPRWLDDGNLLVLLPVLALAFFWQLGATPLFDLDEGAFSAATREMLQRGDYITTFLNGEPRFDKPILIYWLQALSVSAFGLQEWALRLPSALAASGWVLATYQFAHQRMEKRHALFAALMLTNTFMVVIIGRAATADAVLNLLIALSLFELWRYWETPSRAILLRGFVWIGLGFLCKGPVATMIPLVVSGIWYISQRRWRDWLGLIFTPYGVVLFLLITLPWYVLEYRAQGQAFIDGFFFKHNIRRFTSTMEHHGGHIWYYLLALPLIILPFTGLLGRLSVRALQTPLNQYLALWFVFVFVFFSFSSTQLPHYLLYGITPLILLLAQQAGNNPGRWLTCLPPLLLATVLLFLPELMEQALAKQTDAYHAGLLAQVRQSTASGYHLAAGIYFVALLSITLWPALAGLRRMVLMAILQTTFMVSILIPLAGDIQQDPVKNAARFAYQHLDNATIVMDGLNMPSFSVYREKITPRRPARLGEYVFTAADQLSAAYQPVFQQGGIVIAKRIASDER